MLKYYLFLLASFWHITTYANDDCPNAITLTPNLTCNAQTGSFNGATISGPAPSCASEALQDVWYKFTATDVTMSVSMYASNANLAFQVFQGGCNGTVTACVNNSFSGAEDYFNNNFIVGQEYYIRVLNATAQLSTASFSICVTKYPTPANDLCANAVQLTAGTSCNSILGTFNGTLMDGNSAACAPEALQDAWYKFTATDVTMGINLYASNANLALQILQGGCNGTVIACVNNNFSGSEDYFSNSFVVGQEYYVRILNATAQLSIASFTICLTKYPTPANDLCTNAVQLTPGTSCSPVAGTFSGSLKDGGTPACAASASQDVWYKFTATAPTIEMYINGVQYLDFGFEVMQGGCNGTVVACVNSYFSGGGEDYFNNNFVVGQEYYIRVFNASGTLQVRNFNICVMSFPTPANDLCTNAVQLTPGTSCSPVAGTFSGSLKDGGTPACAASASQDVWYKFTATDVTTEIYINGVQYLDLGFEVMQGGCNGAVVACVNSYFSGGGEDYFNNNFVVGQEYYIRVFNASGTLQVRNFDICVMSFPTPANDLCTNAVQLTPGTSCSPVAGTFSGSLKDGGTPACAASASQDVWYKFTATDVTTEIYINGVQYLDFGFEVMQGGCNGTVVACVNSYFSGGGEDYFNNNFVVGQEYYIRVFNSSGTLQVRNFNICVMSFPTPANDLCTNAVQLTPGTSCSPVAGTFSGSLKDGGTPACAASASQDVWYKFTATDVTTEIYINGVQYLDFGFEVMQGGCNGTVVACVNSYFSGGGEDYFNNNFVVGQEYYIRVFNASGTLQVRNFNICVMSFPTPANDLCTNAVQLTPGTSCSPVAGTFSGSLKDGGTPACAASASQDVWYKFTATAATMEIYINGVQYLDFGFEVMQGACNGTIMACVNGYFGGAGEDYLNNNFVIGQEYYIRVFNVSGTLQVRNFNICLIGPPPAACTPSVAISASATTVCLGTSVTFTAVPTNGGSAPGYQWKVNGNNVGTNSPSYTTAALTDGSEVSCTLFSNATCAAVASVTSNVITLNVTNPATPAFTQVAGVCEGGSFTLPTTSNNGITGTWSPAVNTSATSTYTFTPAAGQCANSATMTVMVEIVDAGVSLSGTTITATAAADTYQWIDCATNSIIAGATTASFTPDQNGSYAVVVYHNGCSKTSECIAVTSLGTQVLHPNALLVYPNPATQKLFIEAVEETEIIISDMTGKTIRRVNLQAKVNTIDVTDVAAGLYIIKSKDGGMYKFVKR